MHDLEAKNEMHSMTTEHSKDNKLSKINELNDTMTINESSRDEYEKTLHNLGGTNNG